MNNIKRNVHKSQWQIEHGWLLKYKKNEGEKMRDENCIFCKIANGDIPAKTIYEDDDFRVILDLGPATKGHGLIIPKEHYENLYQMPEELLGKVMMVAKKMGMQMTNNLQADGFNIVQNNGVVAGQTVFHYHMHLIPRYENDNQKIGWIPQNPSVEELEEVQKIILKEE